MNAIELFGSIYEKGAVIFEQDAPGDCMYVIQSGAVEISCRRGGAKVVLNLLAKGDFFGELALIDRRPRSAGATAITRARLLPIGREFFFNRSQTDLSVIFQVMRTLCHRIENTDRVLRALVSRDDSVREAMAATLDSASAAAPDEGGSIARQADACLAYAEAEAVRPAVPPVFFRDTELPVVRFARGETIFNEGDAGEEMFVVVDGAVDIFTEAAGQRILLSRIGPAEFFGEMALVTGHPRTATAVAVADARLISIDNARLSERISRQPELALFIIQVLIVRLRASTVAIESPARSLETLRALLPPVIKKQTRARLAVISLSSCGGCAAMLIQNRNELATLAGLVDVVYCPMLMDAEDFGEVDIALVDGAVRVVEEEDLLLKARRNSRLLIAWGTCAVFGGIPAMANRYELEELYEESFGQAADPFAYYLSDGQPPRATPSEPGAMALLRKARKLDEVVRVDYFLPGCPPRTPLLMDLVRELQGDTSAAAGRAIVCAECPRKATKMSPAQMWAFPRDDALQNICFVSQGALCLGLITKGGCGAACVKGGLPCWGCRGPTGKAQGQINSGAYFEELMSAMVARRTKLDEESLRAVLRILRQTGGSAFCFENRIVSDLSRLR